jgi:hypothetical protein
MSNGAPQKRFNRKEFNSKKKSKKDVVFSNPAKDLDKNLLALEKALDSSDPKLGVDKFVDMQIKKNAREKLKILVTNKAYKDVTDIFDYLEKVTKTENQKPIYDVINDILNNGNNADIPNELKKQAEKIKNILTMPRINMIQEQKNLRNDIYNGFDILNVIDKNVTPKLDDIKNSKALKKLVKIAMESDWVNGSNSKVKTLIEFAGETKAKEVIEEIILSKLNNKNVFDYSFGNINYNIKKGESIVVPFFTNKKFSKLFKELKKDYIDSANFSPVEFTEKILADSQHLLSFKDLASELNYNKDILLKVYENPTNLKNTEYGLDYLIKYLDNSISQLETFKTQNYKPPKLKNKLENDIVNILDEISNNLNLVSYENKEKLMNKEVSKEVSTFSISEQLESLKTVLERLNIKKILKINKSLEYLDDTISELDLL